MTDEEDLRYYRLPRGRHGLPRELVERSQRERLLAAVIEVAAERGVKAMSVADILAVAGVGRQTFYEQFKDKEECLLAAHEAIVKELEEAVAPAFAGPEPWPVRAREALKVVLEWAAANPDAARVALVALGPMGPVARERFLADFHRFTAMFEEGREEAEAAASLPNLTSLAAATAMARIFEEITKNRTENLPAMLPDLTFELLTPFLGEEAAWATAHEEDGSAGA